MDTHEFEILLDTFGYFWILFTLLDTHDFWILLLLDTFGYFWILFVFGYFWILLDTHAPSGVLLQEAFVAR